MFHAGFKANLGSAGLAGQRGSASATGRLQAEVLYAAGEFNRRNVSPCQAGRWLLQHGPHSDVFIQDSRFASTEDIMRISLLVFLLVYSGQDGAANSLTEMLTRPFVSFI